MLTLLISTATNSRIIEILGYISAALESGAAIFVMVLKAITIFKSKQLKDKEKLEAFDNIKGKKK